MKCSHTILQVIPRLDRGGAERTAVEIAEAVVKGGGRALVATAGGALAADVRHAGGEVITLPVHAKTPWVIYRNIARLEKLMEDEAVDLIHARSRAPAWSALFAARRRGVPFVTTYHGAYRAQNPIKLWYNSSMVRSDKVIANSQFTARSIADQFALDPGVIAVIPPGADLSNFDPAKVSAERINHVAQRWDVEKVEVGGERRFRILLPARLTSWKGHEVAIDATAHLRHQMAKFERTAGKFVGLTVVFCGDAQGRRDYAEALRERIAERGGARHG